MLLASRMKRTLTLLPLALLACERGAEDTATTLDHVTGESVTIARDETGTPHIYARSTAAAMYGLGYAQAQDRLFQMNYRRLAMQGRLAEHFAEDESQATGADLNQRRAFNQDLIAKDSLVRRIGYDRIAQAKWNRLPGDTPKLLKAFADGVNAYLASSGFTLSEAFTSAGITSVDPWRPEDALLVWDFVGRAFGGPNIQSEINKLLDCEDGNGCSLPPCDRPIDEGAAVVPQPEDGEWPPPGSIYACHQPGTEIRPEIEFKASHGWVVHGSRLTTGKSALFTDPKLPLNGPSPLYQSHVHTLEMNARGVGFAGAPGFIIFWNEFVGQTVTAGGGDIGDLFELSPSGAGYVVDGQTLTYDTHTETIAVRFGAPVTITIRESVFGPVVTESLANVPAGREFAVRHVEHFEPDRHTMVAVLNMMRATSLAEYRAALNEWMSPTVNALYAGVDRGDTGPGHIAYHALFGMPERVTNVVQGLDLTGRIPFDGSTRANDWRSIRGLDWHPFVIDPPEGYLFSGNHLPVGSWYDDVVGYTGLAGNGDSLRSLRLRYLFDRALGASAVVTPRTIHAFHFDAGGTHVELLADVLEALLTSGAISIPAASDFGATRNEMAGKTLAALRLWLASGAQIETSNPWFPITRRAGPRMIQQSRYGANPEFSCTYNEAAGGVAFALKTFDRTGQITPELQQFAITVAALLWNDARGDGVVADPSQWPSVVPPPPTPIQFQANWSCLDYTTNANFCSLDAQYDTSVRLDRNNTNTLASVNVTSYTASIDFSDVDAAEAIAPPGVSEHVTSPHFADVLPALENVAEGDLDALLPAPLTRALVTELSVQTLRYAP